MLAYIFHTKCFFEFELPLANAVLSTFCHKSMHFQVKNFKASNCGCVKNMMYDDCVIITGKIKKMKMLIYDKTTNCMRHHNCNCDLLN